jgi:hypothetical protein
MQLLIATHPRRNGALCYPYRAIESPECVAKADNA